MGQAEHVHAQVGHGPRTPVQRVARTPCYARCALCQARTHLHHKDLHIIIVGRQACGGGGTGSGVGGSKQRWQAWRHDWGVRWHRRRRRASPASTASCQAGQADHTDPLAGLTLRVLGGQVGVAAHQAAQLALQRRHQPPQLLHKPLRLVHLDWGGVGWGGIWVCRDIDWWVTSGAGRRRTRCQLLARCKAPHPLLLAPAHQGHLLGGLGTCMVQPSRTNRSLMVSSSATCRGVRLQGGSRLSADARLQPPS